MDPVIAAHGRRPAAGGRPAAAWLPGPGL